MANGHKCPFILVATPIPLPDARLRPLVQVASDLAGKPISQLRVLDLACREGHYAIDAMQGAEALGIEYRAESFAKARFVKDYLHLDRLTLYQGDLRNLSREKYGEFAVVICSGILYHLDAPLTITFTSSLNTVGRGEDRANCGTATQRVNPATNASSQTSFP